MQYNTPLAAHMRAWFAFNSLRASNLRYQSTQCCPIVHTVVQHADTHMYVLLWLLPVCVGCQVAVAGRNDGRAGAGGAVDTARPAGTLRGQAPAHTLQQ
jgi:hypothetical protein